MIQRHLPVRKLTHQPGFHWFGYYDKHEFDSAGRYVLGMKVDFEGRSGDPADSIEVGMVDLAAGDEWIALGRTSAWCWQQGCMLQWLGGSDGRVIWNDRADGRFICRILDVATGREQTVGHPIYAVSPDGRVAVAPDFARINDMRPGYGYAGLADPCADQAAPDDSGIWRVNLATGEAELIISIARIAAVPYLRGDPGRAKHYFNHLLFNPDGTRFVFLHRWGAGGGARWATRMFTARPDGSEVRMVTDGGGKAVSHFTWADPGHLNVWTGQMGGFALYADDGSGRGELIIESPDGHQSYLPGGRWMVYDGYPGGRRTRSLMLLNLQRREVFEVGRFHSPGEYAGPLRCDLHPRISRDGRAVVIDSVHEGDGRQMYMLDVSQIVGR